MLAEILQNQYTQLILAISTLLGGIVAYRELFSIKKESNNNLKKQTKTREKTSVITINSKSTSIKDHQYIGEVINDIANGRLGEYSKAYSYFLQHDEIQKKAINNEYIKNYICPILNNIPVGVDEFEKENTRTNMEQLKEKIKRETHIAETKVYITIKDYDFSKHGFYALLYYDDFTYESLNFSINKEKSTLVDKFFIKIENKEFALKWKADFYLLNNKLLLPDNYKTHSPGGPDSIKIVDKCWLAILIENCRFNTSWGDGTTIDVSIIGMMLKYTKFPEIPR